MIYALDTNIISYMLRKDAAVIARYRQEADLGHEFAILPIVHYEIERWLLAQNYKKMLIQFNLLCQAAEQVEFDQQVWRQAALIYAALSQSGELIDDADIFIASFCLVHGYSLVTNNTRHFTRINGLHIVKWIE